MSCRVDRGRGKSCLLGSDNVYYVRLSGNSSCFLRSCMTKVNQELIEKMDELARLTQHIFILFDRLQGSDVPKQALQIRIVKLGENLDELSDDC